MANGGEWGGLALGGGPCASTVPPPVGVFRRHKGSLGSDKTMVALISKEKSLVNGGRRGRRRAALLTVVYWWKYAEKEGWDHEPVEMVIIDGIVMGPTVSELIWVLFAEKTTNAMTSIVPMIMDALRIF